VIGEVTFGAWVDRHLLAARQGELAQVDRTHFIQGPRAQPEFVEDQVLTGRQGLAGLKLRLDQELAHVGVAAHHRRDLDHARYAADAAPRCVQPTQRIVERDRRHRVAITQSVRFPGDQPALLEHQYSRFPKTMRTKG